MSNRILLGGVAEKKAAEVREHESASQAYEGIVLSALSKLLRAEFLLSGGLRHRGSKLDLAARDAQHGVHSAMEKYARETLESALRELDLAIEKLPRRYEAHFWLELSYNVHEAFRGTDLSGDGDTDDRVVTVYSLSSGTTVDLGFSGSKIVGGEDSLVVLVSEAEDGQDLNDDGDLLDDVCTSMTSFRASPRMFDSPAGSWRTRK